MGCFWVGKCLKRLLGIICKREVGMRKLYRNKKTNILYKKLMEVTDMTDPERVHLYMSIVDKTEVAYGESEMTLKQRSKVKKKNV